MEVTSRSGRQAKAKLRHARILDCGTGLAAGQQLKEPRHAQRDHRLENRDSFGCVRGRVRSAGEARFSHFAETSRPRISAGADDTLPSKRASVHRVCWPDYEVVRDGAIGEHRTGASIASPAISESAIERKVPRIGCIQAEFELQTPVDVSGGSNRSEEGRLSASRAIRHIPTELRSPVFVRLSSLGRLVRSSGAHEFVRMQARLAVRLSGAGRETLGLVRLFLDLPTASVRSGAAAAGSRRTARQRRAHGGRLGLS